MDEHHGRSLLEKGAGGIPANEADKWQANGVAKLYNSQGLRGCEMSTYHAPTTHIAEPIVITC